MNGVSRYCLNRSYPLQEIGVVAGEADQAQGVLEKALMHGIDERRKGFRILPIILFGYNKRPCGRQAPMKLNDPVSLRI